MREAAARASNTSHTRPAHAPIPSTPLYRFLGPRYWAIWIGLGLIRLISYLPLPAMLAIGRAFGRIALRFSRRDRRIAQVNIDLCLPELDAAARRCVLRDHFENLGCTLFETALAWWSSDARLVRLVQVEGADHLHAALARGRGALMLSAHFSTLELGVRALGLVTPFSFMYLTPKNALVAELSGRYRSQRALQALSSEQIRELLQNLKHNLPVWYAPDQRFNDKNSALVPFFGLPAGSNIATSRLARISGATVLPYFSARKPDNSGYVVTIHPPFDDFPSDDPIADTQRYHALIEAHVRQHPGEYLWTYKRFKRPGFDPYRR
jgi:Kdo2-lipid IVA lauroyltransferase/acyltransferase